MAEKRKITQSLIGKMADCPRKKFYRYDECLESKAGTNMVIGRWGHDGIEGILRSYNLEDGAGNPIGLQEDARVLGVCIVNDLAGERRHHDSLSGVDSSDRSAETDYVEQVATSALRHMPSEWLDVEPILIEEVLTAPIINPATGKASWKYELAAKIDHTCRLPDGSVALRELKFTGSPHFVLNGGTELQRRVYSRFDLGIDKIQIPVVKIPGIKQRTKREPETFDEYLARVNEEYRTKPNDYYIMREYPVMPAPDEMIWAFLQHLLWMERQKDQKAAHWQNWHACSARGKCPYWILCHEGDTEANRAMFDRVEAHIELKEVDDES